MSIGELAAESGLPSSTIRYWERIGVLPRPVRAGRQRRYSADAVQRLAVLCLAQACGFRLDEMRHLLHEFGPGVTPPRRWQELARRKQQELDEQMARLKATAAGGGSCFAMSVRRTVGVWAHCRIRHGIRSMKSLVWYSLAALGEIAGCFAFWAWLRLGKSPLWPAKHARPQHLHSMRSPRVSRAGVALNHSHHPSFPITKK